MSDNAINNNYFKNLFDRIIKENPVFILILGLCPSLAITTMVGNALVMGFSVCFVMFFSSFFISLAKNFIPERIKVLTNLLIISIFVTITDIFLKAFLPFFSLSLSYFVPLITVNCIILISNEFAYKNKVSDSVINALGLGLGFTLALVIISFFREILGTCQIDLITAFQDDNIFSFFNDKSSSEIIIKNVFGNDLELFSGMAIMLSSCGGFIVIGLLLALVNALKNKFDKKA